MECVDDPEKWTPFKLTHVVYPIDDRLGEILAVISLTPFAILVGFATLILFRRDLHTMFFALGIFINEGANWILKHWLREARPCFGKKHWVEFGMPSSHAQFMWFFTMYILFFLFVRLTRPSAAFASRDLFWKIVVFIACLVTSSTVSYGRIYLGYHSWRQVIYGNLVGATLGSLWFAVVHWLATPIFPWITSLRISETLMIRDSTPVPNIMFFEYTYTRLECRKRSRKSSFHRH